MNAIAFTRLENDSFWQITALIISVNKFVTLLIIIIIIIINYYLLERSPTQDIELKWKVDFNIYKIRIFKIHFVILPMVLGYREAAVGARLVYSTFLWVVYRDLGYLLRLCPGPVPYNKKYKKSCQDKSSWQS